LIPIPVQHINTNQSTEPTAPFPPFSRPGKHISIPVPAMKLASLLRLPVSAVPEPTAHLPAILLLKPIGLPTPPIVLQPLLQPLPLSRRLPALRFPGPVPEHISANQPLVPPTAS